MTSRDIKQALAQLENERVIVEETFNTMLDDEENDLQDIKHQLAQINEKYQRWQQDPQLIQLLNEEENVLIERFNHQQQFLSEIAEKRTSYQKHYSQTENELYEQLKQEDTTPREEDSNGITS